MIATMSSWERRLLDLAYEPLRQHKNVDISVPADEDTLTRAYDYSTELTHQHSKTFFLASALLPPNKRSAVRALYAFCRVSDDLVDEQDAGDDRLTQLEAWRQRALAPRPPANDPVALAWADTRARYRIPIQYAAQLIDGVARDIQATRYATFADLAEYAYGVASTVGLMAMHIVGFYGPEAIPYAVKLGIALQLTNILRDVGEDWRNGRLYLPLDELAAFGLREEDVAAGRVDKRWIAFIRFQIERARRLYTEALPGLAWLHPDGRFAIAAAAELYRAILRKIETHGYNVFTRRAHVGRWGKLLRLPGIWWRARWARR
ncbi:MAG: squalene/phytoene synthase family protein [Anaerolineae bacterium]|nr:squalene/phytoene synthase family protein [Anaerolineae bacterium]